MEIRPKWENRERNYYILGEKRCLVETFRRRVNFWRGASGQLDRPRHRKRMIWNSNTKNRFWKFPPTAKFRGGSNARITHIKKQPRFAYNELVHRCVKNPRIQYSGAILRFGLRYRFSETLVIRITFRLLRRKLPGRLPLGDIDCHLSIEKMLVFWDELHPNLQRKPNRNELWWCLPVGELRFALSIKLYIYKYS